MIAETQDSKAPVTRRKPGTMRVIWLIAWRQIVEAVRNRSTFITTGFFLVFQTVMVLVVLRSFLSGPVPAREVGIAGTFIAFYLLFAGLMPTTPAVSIASGVFAGDKERGCLTPLLVTPASNTEIFAGKVLGSVLPALAYAAIGIIVYLAEIALFFGAGKLALLPLGLTILILLLIPALAVLGAAIASVISSRVSTFQSAQNYSSLILVVLWFGFFALNFLVGMLGLWVFAVAVAGMYVLDVVLIVVAAVTWRREEVMARQ